VLLRFRPDASPDRVVALRDGLLDLRAQVEEIRHISFGPNLAAGAEAWPWVVVVHVDDMTALGRYAVHPAHRKVVEELLTPILAERLAVDVSMDTGRWTWDT
jgi:hypothetical protein